MFTVPFNGAQLPTAFRATIQNLGPAADTYNLTLSNLPSGFTLLDSGTSVTVPAGQTGFVGIYLEPTAGQPIPPPGTQLSFTVTATSTTDSSITQTQTETFTVPAIDAVTLTNDSDRREHDPRRRRSATRSRSPTSATCPRQRHADRHLATGLAVTTPAPVSLAVGQSTTETITLTPDASTPLNSNLEATITATYGPSASPLTQTLPIPVTGRRPRRRARSPAPRSSPPDLGNTDLATELDDLSTALTNLVENPTDPVYRQPGAGRSHQPRSARSPNDPFLASFTAALSTARPPSPPPRPPAPSRPPSPASARRWTRSPGTSATRPQHGFTIGLSPSVAIVQPARTEVFDVVMTNNGTAATTYDLSVSGLPAGVTCQLQPAAR